MVLTSSSITIARVENICKARGQYALKNGEVHVGEEKCIQGYILGIVLHMIATEIVKSTHARSMRRRGGKPRTFRLSQEPTLVGMQSI